MINEEESVLYPEAHDVGVALLIHGNQGIHGVLLPIGTAN